MTTVDAWVVGQNDGLRVGYTAGLFGPAATLLARINEVVDGGRAEGFADAAGGYANVTGTLLREMLSGLDPSRVQAADGVHELTESEVAALIHDAFVYRVEAVEV